MKKYIKLPFVALILLFVGCEKNDGFITDEYLQKLEAVPVVNVAVNSTGSQAIDATNLGSFQGKFDVSLYFPNSPAPTKVDIVVRKNASNSNVKVFQAGATTFPGTFTVTAAQLAALFGTPVKLGDNYDFGADVYVGDKKYEAFPITGVGNGSGPINMIGYSEFARFGAICGFDPAIYEGNFVVVSDAFQDLAAGTVVTLTRVSANSFRMTYPNPNVTPTSPVPTFVVVVNTGNNNISIAPQQVGTLIYGVYNNPTVQATSGFVAPCDKTVRLNIGYTVTQGSFGGPYPLILRKQ